MYLKPSSLDQDGGRTDSYTLLFEMQFSETGKEVKRSIIRDEFFNELEIAGIERESYFDPVELGICSNL